MYKAGNLILRKIATKLINADGELLKNNKYDKVPLELHNAANTL